MQMASFRPGLFMLQRLFLSLSVKSWACVARDIPPPVARLPDRMPGSILYIPHLGPNSPCTLSVVNMLHVPCLLAVQNPHQGPSPKAATAV